MQIASRPDDAVAPDAVVRLAGGRPLTPAWENELGGLTFSFDAENGVRYVKWNPHGNGIDLDGERERLAWAGRFVPVPRVLGRGSDAAGSWLITAALPGGVAVADRWTPDPAPAVTAIATGLRAMHDRLPVADCPFDWSAEARLATARRRAADGVADSSLWHPVHASHTVASALHSLADVPPVDRLVVCHGDACAPNTLLDDDGRWTGNVDLGALGVADRWADLAIATWSLEWNFGPGWEGLLLDVYGVDPDPDRTAYYRLLWDLS